MSYLNAIFIFHKILNHNRTYEFYNERNFNLAKWILKENDANLELMSEILKISENTAYVLANRNIRSKNAGIKFLNPSMTFFHDTKKMKDVDKGIEIVLNAVKNNKKVTVYGDYDADGITSTTILIKGLKDIGCNANFYIPDREKEGYGLNKNAISQIRKSGTDLLITCDNGIASLEEVLHGKNLGLEILIIDHHEPGFVKDGDEKIDVIPKADAIINPKQKDCTYPFELMCAAGICYKFMMELYNFIKKPFDEHHELLIFAMMGTFCDIVDLLDENRILVKNGLYFLNNEEVKNIGLKALMREKSLTNKRIDSFDIGFIIGPCINASGRLSSASKAVNLFLTDDKETATSIAKELSELNESRKEMTEQAFEKAVIPILKNLDNDFDNISPVIIVYDEEIHESIAGIVAGRIKELFYHPTIVLTKGKDCAKGSARSIEGYNIFENLYENRDLFLRFGGHPMAAGLSLNAENIPILQQRLNDSCTLSPEDFSELIYIDKRLELDDVSFELVKELEILEPYGKGNKEPFFLSENISLSTIRVIEEKNTMIFTFDIPDSYRKIKGIYFGRVINLKRKIKALYDENTCDKIMLGNISDLDLKMNLIYTVEINEYNGNFSLQLRLKDFIFAE